MPIFEYSCNACSHEFEELVFSRDECPPCPECGSEDTGKLMSACRAKTGGATPDVPDAAPSGPTYNGIGSANACAGCSGGDCSSCGS